VNEFGVFFYRFFDQYIMHGKFTANNIPEQEF
jgi:hypothetical protein